ncbi:uncharacterized protein LOC105832125 isoform X3 [Monomorium pharaonis]|uniref:uncharacterized protein LOC105832125 isoform X3 n=1 Tax=Monomorium pharaonis TaxID=307658 RepID=UPI001746F487|nr:uncharacterized protein LOC105832125 isoform X3 [Monomorium pharaonis]
MIFSIKMKTPCNVIIVILLARILVTTCLLGEVICLPVDTIPTYCDVGGICGVFIGFSFISVVEFLYFFAFVLRDLISKKSALQKDDICKDKITSVQNKTKQTIYWNELVPRSWHSAKYGKFFTNKARY